MTLGAHFLDESGIRARISDAGKAAVGLGSTGKAERQHAYETWLFPHPDDAPTRAGMADGMFSCGLNALACFRAAGVDAIETSLAYSKNIGKIFSWLGDLSKRAGAYVDLSSAAKVTSCPVEIDAGDVLVVSGPDHVIVLTERLDDGRFLTSEGGRPEAGANGERGMCIHSRTVVVETRADGRMWVGGVDDRTGQTTKGRRVEWMISAQYLA